MTSRSAILTVTMMKSLTKLIIINFLLLLVSARIQIPEDYEVVYPLPVDENGLPLSTNFYHANRKRARRSPSAEKLYFNISGINKQFHLELSWNRNLIAPGFRVYHRSLDFQNVSKPPTGKFQHDALLDKKCYYTGKIFSEKNSSVALTVCDGMRGLIRTFHDDYIIEPLPPYLHLEHLDQHLGSPHIMYRKSTLTLHTETHFEARNYEPGKEIKKNPEFESESRKRKSRSLRRYNGGLGMNEHAIEMLVIVDKTMYWNHGKENITTYVLSIFNIVSQLFQDSSIGNKLNVVLVGLILLEGEEPGLVINHHADQTLNNFCQWQSLLIGHGGRHHDHAILLTGVDVCSYKNAPCETLGFAPIKGMCKQLRSCTINEDTGLSTAFTIAHEIGHNFGMFHDGEKNNCHKHDGTIMSATLNSHNGLFRWSECSRNYLSQFLRSLQSRCLKNYPQHVAELQFPDKLPGELYDADMQCKWQFGVQARVCLFDFGKDVCKSLWCYRGGQMCETKFLPAAEGTTCSARMWCRQGSCVSHTESLPASVDGHWSAWSHWTSCSRSCGDGVKERKRKCNNPVPQNRGKYCKGYTNQFMLCNTKDCPVGGMDYRVQQCASYNTQPFRGQYYRWKPYTKIKDVSQQCKLYCQPENYNFFFALASKVADGTRCNKFSEDICIEGICQQVGCDFIVNSPLRKDICGVCKGDNSSCTIVTGEFLNQPKPHSYFPVAVIPKGARSITISEKSLSSNYLSLRNIFGKYYLNGNWHLDEEGTHLFGGSRFVYYRSRDDSEKVVCEGPLLEDIVIELLVIGENNGVQYSYTVPKSANTVHSPKTQHTYSWVIVESGCSEQCGEGEKLLSMQCQHNNKDNVDNLFCNQLEKPKMVKTSCNHHPCAPRWLAGAWRPCSKSCGGGKQQRKIYCKQKVTAKLDRRVKKRLCRAYPKPHRRQRCSVQQCPLEWHVGKWSQCSVTCGKGIKQRQVICIRKQIKGLSALFQDSDCLRLSRPQSTKQCQRHKCTPKKVVQWALSSWSTCVATCGTAVRKRELKCTVKDHSKLGLRITPQGYCKHINRPKIHLEEKCGQGDCHQLESYHWHHTSWSMCSSSCGVGVQKRTVHCVNSKRELIQKTCDPKLRPVQRKLCNSGPCPSDKACADSFKYCKQVLKYNLCNHTMFGTKCCKSCNHH